MTPSAQMRSRLTLVIACSLAVLVGSAGGAVAGSLVTGAQIKDRSLTGMDIKDGSVLLRDLRVATRSTTLGAPGPAGPAGPTGVEGPAGEEGQQGPTWPRGLSGYQVVTRTATAHEDERTDVQATCPPGKVTITASGWLEISAAPVQSFHDGRTGVATTLDPPRLDTLHVWVVCGWGNS